jgi:hypothetical protein
LTSGRVTVDSVVNRTAPEPSSVILLSIGGLGALLCVSKRRHSRNRTS